MVTTVSSSHQLKTSTMKNLEVKLRITQQPNNLDTFFEDTLFQTDTYFSCPTGRLKLREEQNNSYFIYYKRPDTAAQKLSIYEFYNVPDVSKFRAVFGDLLHEECRVVKKRDLYIIENARVHVDHVENLGMFMEIEVVISTEEESLASNDLLNRILDLTGTAQNERVSVGYRELLMCHLNEEKDLQYYMKTPKMFWVVNKDIGELFKANDIVPCLFTEFKDGRHFILQLDLSVKEDGCKYTMWRKLVGQKYEINCQTLLISQDHKLYTLSGDVIDPTTLGRSSVHVHRSMLARWS